MATSPLRGSPLNGFNQEQHASPRARARPFQIPKCSIVLEKVIGDTITGSNGFDSLPEGSFAVCAGSTAVVSRFHDNGEVQQSVFRAPSRITQEPASIDATINSPFRTRGRRHPRASILPNGPLTPDSKESPTKGALIKKPRGTSCLTLSPSGQWLAIGEAGYSPRVLLFATTNTEYAVSIVAEHVSAVQNLCFSPDSKWLCSVGDIYDGCVFLWSVSSKGALKLCASSKCTSTIYSTKWIGDSSIITAGVRHLKIWRPETTQEVQPSKSTYPPRTRFRQDSPVPLTPGPRSLSGRNVLLNDLLESTFTAVCAIDDTKALTGSDLGDVSIVYIDKGTKRLEAIANIGCPIRCMTIDQKRGTVYVATARAIFGCRVADLIPGAHFIRFYEAVAPIAVGIVDSGLLWIDERSYIVKEPLNIIRKDGTVLPITKRQVLRAHPDNINGSLLMKSKSSEQDEFASGGTKNLVSFDKTGSIISWSATGAAEQEHKIELALPPQIEDEPNQLYVLRQSDQSGMKVFGDKYGSIGLCDDNWYCLDKVCAHASEVNDITFLNAVDAQSMTVISCGRDRIIQVFRAGQDFKHLQTIEQHNGSVNKLEVVEQDNTTLLLSLSADRTILIHRSAEIDGTQAFMCVKILTFKSTPLSCMLDIGTPGILAVSTTDKQIQMVQLKNGLIESSIRIMDEDEPVIIQDMVMRTTSTEDKTSRIILGYSNADRALRIHNAQNGEIICKASGHSEAITSMTILEEKSDGGILSMRVVTTSLDGTLMFWQVSHNDCADRHDLKNGATKEIQQTPLRKVLSRSQLANFAATIESGDWSPLPSPTREYPTFRNTSPDRMRRRTSMTNLLRDSPTPVLTPNPRPGRQRDTSPASRTPTNARRKTVMPQSRSSDDQALSPIDLAHTSTQLINSLRNFRTSLRSQGNLDTTIQRDLKLELETTLEALREPGNATEEDSSQNNTSFFSAVDGIRNMIIEEEEK